MRDAGRLTPVSAATGGFELKGGVWMRSICGVTKGVLCLVIAAVIAAVALTQSSPNVHAQPSIIRSWSHQMGAPPKQLGSTSSNGYGYNPFKIRIVSLEARGQLNVEEQEEQFLLNKENELILLITKTNEAPGSSIEFRNHTGATIELRSNNPDVLLCGRDVVPRKIHHCTTEITSPPPFNNLIIIRGQNLEDLAKAAGVLDKEVAQSLLSFDLDGKIDGQQFSAEGEVIYDNTEQSKLAFDPNYRSRARNQKIDSAIRKLFPLAIAIILVVPFIWLGMKKSQR